MLFFYELKEEDKSDINEIWNNFSKDTGYEVAIIENPNDIILGQENIFTKFAHSLSGKIFLTEDEKKRYQKILII